MHNTTPHIRNTAGRSDKEIWFSMTKSDLHSLFPILVSLLCFLFHSLLPNNTKINANGCAVSYLSRDYKANNTNIINSPPIKSDYYNLFIIAINTIHAYVL